MSKWSRFILTGLLGLAVAVGVGCSTGKGPTEPSIPAGVGQPDALLRNVLKDLRLLSCSTQPYAVRTQDVGPAGGIIAVGTHRLEIPVGALRKKVTIRAEQVPGRVNSVRFYPEGLQFDRPATLTLSYSNCSPLMLLKRIVYTDERLKILELLPSIDNLTKKTVTGYIRHFSRYAVAW